MSTMIRMDSVIQRSAGELFGGIAEYAFNRWTRIEDAALRGTQHNPLCAFLDHRPKAILTLSQLLLRLLSVVDIDFVAIPPENSPSLVSQGDGASQEPAVFSVRPPDAQLIFEGLSLRHRRMVFSHR